MPFTFFRLQGTGDSDDDFDFLDAFESSRPQGIEDVLMQPLPSEVAEDVRKQSEVVEEGGVRRRPLSPEVLEGLPSQTSSDVEQEAP